MLPRAVAIACRLAALTAGVLLLSACPGEAPAPPPPAAPSPATLQAAGVQLPVLPASFRGVLPCADCAGIDTQVALWPGGGAMLREQYLDVPAPRVHTRGGRWHYDAARSELDLAFAGGDVRRFRAGSADELRLLDARGRDIESALPHLLTRSATFTPPDGVLSLDGEFSYLADSARFTDCASGISWPVVMDTAYLALERSYLALRPAPGAPARVRLEARIEQAPLGEGDASREALRLVSAGRPDPAGRCPPP